MIIRMQWVAITGPIGSGKSTVARLLREMGFEVLDADQTVHQALGPGGAALQKVFQTFGEQLKQVDGTLDRRALGRMVFGHPDKLKQLEDILHPLVRADVQARREILDRQGVQTAFYDVPLLFEKKMQSQFNSILVVSASQALREKRLHQRSRLSVEEIAERSKHQVSPAEKEAGADFVIRNEGDLEKLQDEVLKALRHIGVVIPKKS
jgi:dephospho-CoA kinase